MKPTSILLTSAALASTISPAFSAPVPPSFEARLAPNPELYIISPLSSNSYIESTMPVDDLKEKHRPISQPNEIRVVRPEAVENFTQPGMTKPSGNNRDGFTKQGEREGATSQHSKRGVYPAFANEALGPVDKSSSYTFANSAEDQPKEEEGFLPVSTQRSLPQSEKKMSKWNKYVVVPAAGAAVVALGLGAAWSERQQPGWESKESWAHEN